MRRGPAIALGVGAAGWVAFLAASLVMPDGWPKEVVQNHAGDVFGFLCGVAAGLIGAKN